MSYAASPLLALEPSPQSPLWVISGHTDPFTSCPLYPRQRTFVGVGGMSEKCHLRTMGLATSNLAV
jgi:hypothetical protein